MQAIIIYLSLLSNFTSNISVSGPLEFAINDSSLLPFNLADIAFSISYKTMHYSLSIPMATSLDPSLLKAIFEIPTLKTPLKTTLTSIVIRSHTKIVGLCPN